MVSGFKHESQNTHLLENNTGSYFCVIVLGIVSLITCKNHRGKLMEFIE